MPQTAQTHSTYRKIRRTLRELPLFLLLFGVASAAMMVPAFYGLVTNDHAASRAFLYPALLGLVAFMMLALTFAGRRASLTPLASLLTLFSGFVFLPLFLAVPFVEALPTTKFINAYVEMISAFTTTGATLFEEPARLSNTLHLWRAQVGWMGGLLMWVAAAAILAPLHLGGFEVTAQAEPGQQAYQGSARSNTLSPRDRLLRTMYRLAPIYLGLTSVLWLLLLANQESPFIALCHAMSVMATSGISPVGGMENANSGLIGEMAIVMFMVFALSRLTFTTDTVTATQGGLRSDPEFRLGLIIVVLVPLILFSRHWLGAYDVASEDSLGEAALAFWGAAFTVMSFLTTTGFVSEHWIEARDWSGLATPGIILMGLALIGGGVATTAGGVKLLRVFALYRNGVRELEQLVHPNSVSGAGLTGRRLQSGGAFIAWVFFMLLAMSLAGVTLLLTLTGVSFADALVMSIAALSTTGPLVQYGADDPILLIDLGFGAKAVFSGAMVLGRLETLAIIALLSPDLWRA